ncbi:MULTISPECIES: PEP-CTERM sorting domain-containing protein [unclassified Lentimonas]|uniref:PEP-CTERM sorting domain-containing protein n=1 Tax=unclassified Lentimonas TaxID=2630993 RepID=UPI0013280016|nr:MULTISPECIES: PEP-CTERM sorting domain-containing protein [unclassified Lentimonas]CAA6691701.1 Unannotated [Lentimonas sp. CC19]CAA6696035.1 Unannotated [Lentimonas sp. CC10]CAA7070055.1 Unannotated [Lentimonas sp. CC11]
MKTKKTLSTLIASLLMAGAAQASTIVYQDTFGDGDLAVNAGTGGGAINRTISNGVWSEAAGEASFTASNTRFSRNAILYASNTFQSSGGFQLDVDYTIGSLNDSGGNDLSFGIVSSETDFSSYGDAGDSSDNPFASITSVYSLGVNITGASRGLNFTDSSTVTSLDVSGDNAQFVANASTAVSITIGTGGAWSYSIGGVEEATGTIVGGFDLTKSYRFVAYGQDDQGPKTLQSVTLTAIPEPSAYALLAGLTGLALVVARRRQS